MSSMIVGTRSSKRRTEKPLEDQPIRRTSKNGKKTEITKPKPTAPEIEQEMSRDQPSDREEEDILPDEVPVPIMSKRIEEELPYEEVEPLSVVRRKDKESIPSKKLEEKEVTYENHAPLQEEERAKDLIRMALKNPIHITTEDLLNVSEPARQELKRLLTKKRVERKSVIIVANTDTSQQGNENGDERTITVERLPEVTYEVLSEAIGGTPKGAVVIGDPVMQYLSTVKPGDQPKKVIAAKESQSLRAVYPLINGVGEVESLLDSGSQIISMSKDVAEKLDVSWDPDIVIHMQSANCSLEKTLGLAKNVPFIFGNITVYLQVHIIEKPAYKVLLGRPFDVVTESFVKNKRNGGQSITITDPDSGERCVMYTHERGKQPSILRKAVTVDFQKPSMN